MIRRLPSLACTATLAGLMLTSTASHAQTLTVSMFVPASHPMMKAAGQWCGEVSKVTDKRVRCNMLPKPVTSPPGTFDAIRDGQADVSASIHGYTPGRFVLTSIAEFPFLGDSAEITSVAYQRIHERHLAKLDEHKGLKVLAVFTHGPGDIYVNSDKPIHRLADLDGKKFRVGGGMVNDVAKALGANTILKPAAESYELMSSGVVDGVFFPAESVNVYRLEKFIKSRTKVPGGLYTTSFAMVMNADTWGRISKADQAAIDKVSGEHLARIMGREWDASDRIGQETLDKLKVDSSPSPQALVTEISDRTKGLEQGWFQAVKGKGLSDPDKVLAEFRAEIAKEQQKR